MARNSRRARSLAAVLKDVLERAKRQDQAISERSVAPRLGVSNMTVNRWVNGETTPTAEQVASFLTAVGVVGDEKERILSLARAPESEWLAAGPPGMNPQLAAVMECERDATAITVWSPLMIPGLLQTPDYARTVISRGSPNLTPHEVDSMVMVRNARRDILVRPRPAQFHALIGLPAIHAGVGGPQVMAEQLAHVAQMAARDNITVRVFDLSGDWSPAHLGPFIIYESATIRPTVYLEHHRSGAFLDEEGDVAAYQTAADQIRREAMSPDQSAGLIADAITRAAALETTG
jgi:transcriptional regulator with XRE-family HTH domain